MTGWRDAVARTVKHPQRRLLESRIEAQRKTNAGLEASYHRAQAECDRLRKQLVVLWRDALRVDRNLLAVVDDETFHLHQRYATFELGQCEMCDARAPLWRIADPNGSEQGMDVCAWGCPR